MIHGHHVSPLSTLVLAGLVAGLAVGCGDDSGESGSDSASSTTTAASESEGTSTSVGGTVSDSATTTTSAGSMSDSNTVTSDSATVTSDSATSGSATATTAVSESESASDSDPSAGTTTGPGTTTDPGTGTDTDTDGVDFCGEGPPPGFMGEAAECLLEPEVGTFSPIVEWTKSTFVAVPNAREVVVTPVVGPLTDDDKDGVFGSAGDVPAIVFASFAGSGTASAGVLRAIRGDGGGELFSVSEGVYGGSGVAIGDLEGDGEPDIVALAVGGIVKAFDRSGAVKWSSAGIAAADLGKSLPHYGAPAIADMDGDGKAEVIVGRVILNHDGTLRGKGAHGVGGSTIASAVAIADIDDDGVQEVIVGDALYRPDGTAIWSNGQADGYPAVADFDGDKKPEIVVVSNGTLRLQGGDGAVIWSVSVPGGKGGPPTIADFDGDKSPEIGVASPTRYVVFDGDGAVLWQQPVKDATSGITGSSVYDFEGDGVADVVYADEIDLYVFSGIDGAIKLKFAEHNSGTALEYPVIADVDNDGEVEIVVVHNTVTGQGPLQGLTVLGDKDNSWRPGRKIWNQHAYSITNVDDHGGIPAKPPANWTTYNNFRSGDLSAPDGLSAPDLELVVPEACARECVGDEAQIWFHLGNTGGVDLLAGAEIEIHGTKDGVESLLLVVPVAGPIGPGEFLAALSAVVPIADLEQVRLHAVSLETECSVDAANDVILEPPFCTP